MEYVRLGRSGLKVSRIGLGMMRYSTGSRGWVLGPDDARPLVRAAVEAGVTLFDTADMYSRGGSEEVTGQLLREFFPRRSDHVLATKVWAPMGESPNDAGLSRAHVLDGIDASLRRLGTDHVDLYQVHRFDPDTPVEETMSALHDVVRAGKARYLGASSMYAWQFAKLQHAAVLGGWTPFVSMQDEYSLLYREEEREMHPLCLDQGVGVLPWGPLAHGRLARPAGAGPSAALPASTPADDAVLRSVERVATGRGVPMARIALAWLLSRPAVTAPLVGLSRPGQLEDAVAATELRLTPDEIEELEAPYAPQPVTAF